MSAIIKIKGIEKIAGKVADLRSMRAVKAGLRAAALHVKGKIAQYPPSSEANSPGQRRWYQRGYGPKWMLASGVVHGKKTSETLGRKWTTKSQDGGLTQVIGNATSYARFVQGDQQAAFHRARGWRTTEDVAEDEADAVVEFLQDEIDRALRE